MGLREKQLRLAVATRRLVQDRYGWEDIREQFADGRQLLSRTLEVERRGALLWFPVLACCGLGLYFSLRFEPHWGMLAALGLASLAAWGVALRTGRWVITTFIVMGLACGAAIGALRTASVDTAVLVWRTGVVEITGVVARVEGEPGRRRMVVIDVEAIEGLRDDRPPDRVKLAMGKNAAAIAAGDKIRVQARLTPLGGPVLPGGFDFGRMQWFRGVGAAGYGFGEVVTLPHEGSLVGKFAAGIERIRASIGVRIRSILDGPRGGMAVALVTGDRSGIEDKVNGDFQVSGLAHIISISGMHMSMVAGSSYFMLRALLALLPGMAVRAPIKKMAASGALVVATGYFLISGFDVATQRAFVTVAIMLLAVLADRPAISMRNVALSALVVLLFHPEAMLSASFHMSFLAVIALVAMFERWKAYKASRGALPMRERRGWLGRFARVIGGILAIDLATTAIAGGATAPVAAFHFQRYATYSMLANLLATPVVGLLVMPFLMFALVMMPFGLDAPFLLIAGAGIDIMLAIARLIATLPGANGVVAAQPTVSILLITGGILVFCLCRTRLRYIGCPLAILGLLATPLEERPMLLVDSEGKVVALRNESGELVLSHGRRGTYSARVWLGRDGDSSTPAQAARRVGLHCEAGICRGLLDGVSLAIIEEKSAVGDACASARIVIAAFRIKTACASAEVLIDRKVLLAEGALRIERSFSGAVTVTSARSMSGERPWVVANQRYQPRPAEGLWAVGKLQVPGEP